MGRRLMRRDVAERQRARARRRACRPRRSSGWARWLSRLLQERGRWRCDVAEISEQLATEIDRLRIAARAFGLRARGRPHFGPRAAGLKGAREKLARVARAILRRSGFARRSVREERPHRALRQYVAARSAAWDARRRRRTRTRRHVCKRWWNAAQGGRRRHRQRTGTRTERTPAVAGQRTRAAISCRRSTQRRRELRGVGQLVAALVAGVTRLDALDDDAAVVAQLEKLDAHPGG